MAAAALGPVNTLPVAIPAGALPSPRMRRDFMPSVQHAKLYEVLADIAEARAQKMHALLWTNPRLAAGVILRMHELSEDNRARGRRRCRRRAALDTRDRMINAQYLYGTMAVDINGLVMLPWRYAF